MDGEVKTTEETGSQILTKEDILGMDDLEMELVIIPQWKNKAIYVRALMANERDDYENGLLNAKRVGEDVEITTNMTNVKARMAVKAIVGADGERLFADSDAPALGKKNAAALNKIVEVIERLSGMSRKDKKSLSKNSGTTQPADSLSV